MRETGSHGRLAVLTQFLDRAPDPGGLRAGGRTSVRMSIAIRPSEAQVLVPMNADTGEELFVLLVEDDRDLADVFALQDDITVSVVAAIEPSLRQAEIERIKRKRPDNLDAYDLLLRALPSVYTCMPDGAAKALPPLEQALAIEPAYALAHGFAAWAHEIIYVRGGMRQENHDGAIRHAYAALEHGRADVLLKPVDPVDLLESVRKAARTLH